jgi:hypothetical protein
MTLVSRTMALGLLCGVLGLSGCVSDSLFGSHTKSKMLATAPPGYECQVVTLRVRDKQYGRLTVDQAVIELLRRREGVLAVRRGTGREEIYVLTETFVDPYSLPRTAPVRYSVRVIDVEKHEPPEVPK